MYPWVSFKETLPGVKRNSWISPASSHGSDSERQKSMKRNRPGTDTVMVFHLQWQIPGPGNRQVVWSLFFPNSFDIYLHDTPSKDLLRRIKGPSVMVAFMASLFLCLQSMYRRDASSTHINIDSLMRLRKKTFRLNPPLPVYLVYFYLGITLERSISQWYIWSRRGEALWRNFWKDSNLQQ